MPELPEVESTRLSLERELLGSQIVSIAVNWPRMILPLSETEMNRRLRGGSIRAIARRAKFLILTVEKGDQTEYLLLHLRMSGRLHIAGPPEEPSPYDRIVVTFADSRELRFRDVRKFGRFQLLTAEELQERLASLGPEPLEKGFRAQDLHICLSRRKRRLKALLLDQSILAGLGNIYVDETLWAAQLHPCRIGASLAQEESSRLFREMRRILREAIRLNGTDFGDGVVYNGKFLPQVYGRAGEPCNRCGEPLLREVVAQRGTVFCQFCQVPSSMDNLSGKISRC
ncbi:bifunctional DNA-formamidopyrimidine glycosylase/DNA-(apurinic or apyrimidinic site) lyase [bacterium]|nr:bifunctional DNA-formamidopyrimidine glycosylase/DNA-(apurinic or apyrimidinic site) lyase [bacterium]